MNAYRCVICGAIYYSAADLEHLVRQPCRHCGATALIPAGPAEKPKEKP